MNPKLVAKTKMLLPVLLLYTNTRPMETSFWVEKVLDPTVEYSKADSILIKAYLKNKSAGLLSKSSKPPEHANQSDYDNYLLPQAQDQDGRERVANATQFPYCSIGYVKGKFNGPSRQGHGTGFLVGPQHFLTAAHVLCRLDKDEWERWPVSYKIRCAVNGHEQYYKKQPFAKTPATRLFVPRAYIEEGNKDYDFALVILRDSIGIDRGWFGCLFGADSMLLKENLTITGYPDDLPRQDLIGGEKKPITDISDEELSAALEGDPSYNGQPDVMLNEPGYQQWTMSGSAKSITPEKIFYSISTSNNQSGSPIYIRAFNGMPYVVGVHTDAEPAQGAFNSFMGWGPGRSGVRFTESKFHHLMDAIGQTGMIIVAIPRSPSNPALLINFQKELLRRQQEQELNEKNRKEWRNYDLEWYRDEPTSIQELHIKVSELAEHDAKHQEVKRLQTDFMEKWAALKTQSAEKINVK